jgi:hypothetical protein
VYALGAVLVEVAAYLIGHKLAGGRSYRRGQGMNLRDFRAIGFGMLAMVAAGLGYGLLFGTLQWPFPR